MSLQFDIWKIYSPLSLTTLCRNSLEKLKKLITFISYHFLFQSSYDANTFSDTLYYGNTPKSGKKKKTHGHSRVRKVSTNIIINQL